MMRINALYLILLSASILLSESKDSGDDPELMLKVYKDGKGSYKRDKHRYRDEYIIQMIKELENEGILSPLGQSLLTPSMIKDPVLPPMQAPMTPFKGPVPPPMQAPTKPKPISSPTVVEIDENKPPTKPNNPKPTNKPNNNNNQNGKEKDNGNDSKNNNNKPTKNPTKKPANNENKNKDSTKKPTKKPTSSPNKNKSKNNPTKAPTKKPNNKPNKNTPTNKPNKNSPTNKPNKNEPSNNTVEGRSKNDSGSSKIQLVQDEISQDVYCETAYYRASSSLDTCLQVNNKGGCSNSKCEELVCKTIGDSFCCDAIWDENCVESAKVFCAYNAKALLAEKSNCYSFTSLSEPGCSNKACEKFICDMLPGCCSLSWNWDCVVASFDYCCLEDLEDV